MNSADQNKSKILWRGRPWIIPNLLVRLVLAIILAVGAIFLEGLMGITNTPYFGLPLFSWTIVAFFVVWVLSTLNLLFLRYTHSYILREDDLEIKIGLLTTKTSVIAPTGFSDLELIRTISGRLFNTGDIIIKTQSEKDYTKKMVKVRDPNNAADLIRKVMARPLVRLDSGSNKDQRV
jgi:uncharacterized membrane protein YdbT with pleckstrin-like domain